jgi:hypothetical protein
MPVCQADMHSIRAVYTMARIVKCDTSRIYPVRVPVGVPSDVMLSFIAERGDDARSPTVSAASMAILGDSPRCRRRYAPSYQAPHGLVDLATLAEDAGQSSLRTDQVAPSGLGIRLAAMEWAQSRAKRSANRSTASIAFHRWNATDHGEQVDGLVRHR